MRYGVIGTGMMGCEHLRNLAAMPERAAVVAINDPVERSLEWGRRAAGRPVDSYVDHRDLLARDDLDAIVIASPNHTHASVLRDALATDLAVMVEKPLCTTIEDCLDVQRRAANRDALTWVALEYRYLPTVAVLLEQLASGVCGTTRMVSIREHRFPFLDKVGNWNRFNRNTGGTLVEKCCHFFDLMRLAAGGARPVRVMASGGQDVNHLDERYHGEQPDILDNAFVIVDFDNGVRGSLDLCMFAEGGPYEQELTVVGDLAKLATTVPGSEVVVGRRSGGPLPIDVPDSNDIRHQGFHHGASFREHVRFIDAARSGKPAEVTIDDGLWSVAMGLAAHRSIAQRRVVSVDELIPAR
jgi:myo-inositol 2-dehydrogenase / D-chiro-inositol 1-dehydrogenase